MRVGWVGHGRASSTRAPPKRCFATTISPTWSRSVSTLATQFAGPVKRRLTPAIFSKMMRAALVAARGRPRRPQGDRVRVGVLHVWFHRSNRQDLRPRRQVRCPHFPRRGKKKKKKRGTQGPGSSTERRLTIRARLNIVTVVWTTTGARRRHVRSHGRRRRGTRSRHAPRRHHHRHTGQGSVAVQKKWNRRNWRASLTQRGAGRSARCKRSQPTATLAATRPGPTN